MWLYSHGYKSDGQDSLARFVRRNAMRQMRWFERAVGGEFVKETERAKQRLVAAQRGRPERASASPPSAANATQLTSRSAATASPGRRRWRRDRDSEPPRPSGPPRLEDADFSDEQVPTVVKPHAMRSVLGPQYAPPAPPREPPLPSFADESDESDPDHRATSVKANVVGGVPSGLAGRGGPGIVPLPPPRIDFASAETARGGDGRALAPNDTVLDMPMVDMETEQTEPRRSPPPAPESLTTPRQRADDAARARSAGGSANRAGLKRTLASAGAAAAAEPALREPEPQPNALLVTGTDLPTRRTNFAALEDVLEEAERLARESQLSADEAETAAKLAAHKTVLAELAADAAHLAGEAYRAAHAGGLAQAVPLLAEAHRIEDTMRRASREPPGTYSPRGSVPPPAPVVPLPEPVEAPRVSPSVPPPAPAFGPASIPPPAPMPPARASRRPEPMRPSDEGATSLLSSEVFGVPVPALLLVTFLVVVALVVFLAVLRQ
ncbi:MAG TPA: hypothetical protein VL400_07715, partial [Polyangiaceae bacterium]|nr:hypothetical protein [Polyangiaceae bacterium]